MADKLSYETCVACGGTIVARNGLRGKHTCPESHDAAQLAAHRAAHDTVPTRSDMPLYQRLDLGFEMLAEDDDN